MARYKVLGSIAHNFGHSLMSTMTFREGDYAGGHLLRAARELGEDTITLDILSAEVLPPAFVDTPGGQILRDWAAWFPDLVEKNGSSLDVISDARLRLVWDLSQELPPKTRAAGTRVAPYAAGSPYDMTVTIVDDRGTEWTAQFHDWEYPAEPSVAPARPPRWKLWR